MDKGGFVKLYNAFTDCDSEYMLNMKELYVYSYLRMLQSKSDDLWVNVDFLHSVMSVKFEGNTTRNKKQISSVIKDLINRNIIICDKDKFNNKDRLLIRFDDRKFGNGHEQVKCSFIDQLEEYQYLYIYVVVARRENTEDGCLKFSYTDWANILNIHRTTAIHYVKECIDKEYIYCLEGKYNDEIIEERGQRKQDRNIYSIKPFDDEVEIKQVDAIASYIETGNWNTNNNLTKKDFDIYVNASPEQQSLWDKKINNIKNSGEKGEWIYENKLKVWLDEAKENKLIKVREEEDSYYNNLCIESERITSKVVNGDRVAVDVALKIGDKIRSYKDLTDDELNNVDILFYEYLVENDSPFGDRLNHETRYIINPSREQIEYYRPINYNGRWRSIDDDLIDSNNIEQFAAHPDDFDDIEFE